MPITQGSLLARIGTSPGTNRAGRTEPGEEDLAQSSGDRRAIDIPSAARLPGPAGADRDGQRLPRRRRSQHRRRRPALDRRGTFLHADGLRPGPGRGARGAAAALPGGGRRAASRWSTVSPSRARSSGWRSWSRAKTTASPTCSGAGAAASSAASWSRSSPTTPTTPSRSPRSASPSTTSRSSPAPARRRSGGRWSCSTALDLLVLARYMQVLSAGFLERARRAGDQHPPQLPARLRRRRPLPPRARARGQADRRHRPLRHRRSSTPGRSSTRT